MADTVDIRNTVGPGRSQRGVASPDIRVATRRLQAAQILYQRASETRMKERASILRHIKKTSWLVVGCALSIAVISDLLSIVDLGWVVSWAIPIVSWFMVRRINSIMKSSELIAKATNRLSRQEALVRQRVTQIIPPAERGRLLVSERVSAVSEQTKTYVRTWIRDSAITQLIELIPVVDILPLYLGQVVKMVINQNIEYQKVRKLMPAYERTLARTDELERMEIMRLEQLAVDLLGEQVVLRQAIASDFVAGQTPAQPRSRIAPGPDRAVRDIQPTENRIPAQPRPRIAPGPGRTVRDIQPAAALPAAA